MDNDKLNELFVKEKEYREQKNNQKSISICKEIIELIKNLDEKNKFDIILKLFLYENQSNYTKIFIFNDLLNNNSFINNKEKKKKYYQLLIDSFNNNVTKDHLEQTSRIKESFEKSNSGDFEEIDKFI